MDISREAKLFRTIDGLFVVEYEGERAEFVGFKNALALAAGLADAQKVDLTISVSAAKEFSLAVDRHLVPSSLAPVTVSAAQQETGCLCERDTCDMASKLGMCPFDS